MRKLLAFGAVFVLMGTACVGGGGGDERTVLVDFNHDEFNSIMVDYFPGELEVTPGMTVVFKQTWTGEPHTVTGGALVNEMMSKAQPWTDLFSGFEELVATGANLPEGGEEPDLPLREFFSRVEAAENDDARRRLYAGYDALREQGLALPDRKNPGDATNGEVDRIIEEESNKFFEDLGLPWALDETPDGGFGATQNAGQPCYLAKGAPPKDAEKPCSDAQRRQPVFDGTASYYNSGIIPYEGPQGNTFRVQLTPDIKPGDYFFYCAVHGPDQATKVKVQPRGAKIPPQSVVSRQAREEIEKFAEPMLEVYRDARDNKIGIDGKQLRAPFGGLSAPVFGAINEFFPKTIRTKVGEKVTWKLMGWDHSVSFDVPPYFPIIRFAKDGKVSLNPQLNKPAGGSPEIPEQEGMGVLKVDGGTYDGEGFFSSGLMSSEPYAEYALRFSEPGSYKYACLLHPPMVGTVVVAR